MIIQDARLNLSQQKRHIHWQCKQTVVPADVVVAEFDGVGYHFFISTQEIMHKEILNIKQLELLTLTFSICFANYRSKFCICKGFPNRQANWFVIGE